MGIIGVFSFRQIILFRQALFRIEKSSQGVEGQIKRDLHSMEIIGKIDSTIKTFLLSPSKELLKDIHNLIDNLKNNPRVQAKKDIERLQKDLDTLAVRMESLRANESVIVRAENNIIGLLFKVHALCAKKAVCSNPLNKIDDLFLRLRTERYLALSGDDSYLQFQDKARSTVNELLAILKKEGKHLPVHSKLLSQITNDIMELGEALETITLIRKKALASKKEVDRVITDLSAQLMSITQNKITKNDKEISREFSIAKNTGLLMSAGLVLVAFIIIAFGGYLFFFILIPVEKLGRGIVKISEFFTELGKPEYRPVGFDSWVADLPVERRDEIGFLANALRDFSKLVHDLAVFRHTIQADEDVDVIYRRLATVFKEQLGLRRFYVFDKRGEEKDLDLLICEPEGLRGKIAPVAEAGNCRAIRTATPVSSIEIPSVCKLFPFEREYHHICIPLTTAENTLGVICFQIKKEEFTADVQKNISKAIRYINESIPILQEKRYAKKLKQAAVIDQLTGLFNRRYLESSMEMLTATVRRRQTTLGILMCDIDYFKEVNDHFGHDVGDEVLRQLGGILKKNVRTSDIVVRYGGEEFLIILMDCHPGKEIDIAEKIRKSVLKCDFTASGRQIRLTISIGISIFPEEDSKNIWDSIKKADMALYEAKKAGRNRTIIFN